jgi:hypothetical protein
MAAWDLTPAELQDYAEVYRQRMEDQSYLAYNLAQCIATMTLSSVRPEPWQAFPGWIQREEMTDEQIYASCLAWCGGDPNGSREIE